MEIYEDEKAQKKQKVLAVHKLHSDSFCGLHQGKISKNGTAPS